MSKSPTIANLGYGSLASRPRRGQDGRGPNVRAVAAGLAFMAVTLTTSAANADCKLNLFAELPVTMTDDSPQIGAKINGAPVRLIVDTGAFYSVIPPPEAKALGLILRKAPITYVEGVGGVTDLSITTVKTFTIAGVTIPRVEFLVGGSGVGEHVTGVLGQNFLRLADLDIDLAAGVIHMMKPKGCEHSLMVYWTRTQPYSVLTTDPTDALSSQTTARASVNGADVRVVFDTGGGPSMLSERAARRLGVGPGHPGVVSAGMTSGIGHRPVPTWIAPVASFKIADEEIRNTRLRVGPMSALEDVDMILGADFFLSHRVYIAREQNKVYFTYNGGPVFDLSSKRAAPNGDPKPSPAAAVSATEGASRPADAAGYSRRAAAFVARGDLTDALADLDRACALAPAESAYFFQRGMVHLRMRNTALARGDLDQALKLKPDDVDALIVRAQFRLQAHDEPGAIADLGAADLAAPKESNARLSLGDVFGRAHDYAPAVGQYDLWLKLHPEDAGRGNALNGRCWTRAEWGKELRAALDDCDTALRLMPRSSEILDSRGLVRLRLGDFDGAMADYDAALKLNPKLAWSLYGRGLAELKKGMAAQGKADIAAASAIAPHLPEEVKSLGLAPP